MNKIIFILWFQGFENAPELVKKCLQSWEFHNPDWNIIKLNNNNLGNYIDISTYLKKKINYTALSDIVRCALLKKYGGLWVDSTVFCNKPLNSWLPSYIKEGFFAFNKPAPDRLLSSWFLYSEKNHFIINNWLESVVKYYINNNLPKTYFWFHYLFGDLYNNNDKFKTNWDNVPKISANLPHTILNSINNPNTEKLKQIIDNKEIPIFKLSYKSSIFNLDGDIKNTVTYLFNTIPNK